MNRTILPRTSREVCVARRRAVAANAGDGAIVKYQRLDGSPPWAMLELSAYDSESRSTLAEADLT